MKHSLKLVETSSQKYEAYKQDIKQPNQLHELDKQ
jgi:hypothetical protein